MPETILVALGGNAIKRADDQGTAAEQFENVYKTCQELVKLIEKEYKLVITHGNGPQAGNLLIQQEEAKNIVPDMPLDVVGAMTQGQLGYMFSQALTNTLTKNEIYIPVAALINQVLVSKDDPDYQNPSKPIGPFFTKEEADKLAVQKPNWIIKQVKPESVEKRFRRVVASPKPISNIDRNTIMTLVDAGIIVIASGGGGIPVTGDENRFLTGTAAVIDKDAAGAKLAELIEADILLILTDVSNAKIDFGKPTEKNIETITFSEMKELAENGDFLAGSMGPKVNACLDFIENGGKRAIITSLENAFEAITANVGTQIIPD